MASGRVFLSILISSLSIGVLFGFIGIREEILVLLLWVSIMFWNKMVFWCFWYFNCLEECVQYCGNSYVTLTRQYGYVWRFLRIWQVLVGVMVLWFVGDGWREIKYIHNACLALFLVVYWCCLCVWQVRERTGKLWWRSSRKHRWGERRVIWRLLEHTSWYTDGFDQFGFELLEYKVVMYYKRLHNFGFFGFVMKWNERTMWRYMDMGNGVVDLDNEWYVTLMELRKNISLHSCKVSIGGYKELWSNCTFYGVIGPITLFCLEMICISCKVLHFDCCYDNIDWPSGFYGQIYHCYYHIWRFWNLRVLLLEYFVTMVLLTKMMISLLWTRGWRLLRKHRYNGFYQNDEFSWYKFVFQLIKLLNAVFVRWRGVRVLGVFWVSLNPNFHARRSNSNTFIYENIKLDLQRTRKSLDHQLSSGDMT